MTDPLAAFMFCGDPECLFCATRSPRRSVVAEPDASGLPVDQDAPDAVTASFAHPVPVVPGLSAMLDYYRRALDAESARVADAFGAPVEMVATGDYVPDARPWYERVVYRLARMQPIWFVRSHVDVWLTWRTWNVGVTVNYGLTVHLLCAHVAFYRTDRIGDPW